MHVHNNMYTEHMHSTHKTHLRHPYHIYAHIFKYTQSYTHTHAHAHVHTTHTHTCKHTHRYKLFIHNIIDIDECDTNNGGCEHTCTNSDGSYTCSCNTGYTLDLDDEGCSREKLNHPFFLISDNISLLFYMLHLKALWYIQSYCYTYIVYLKGTVVCKCKFSKL